MGCRISTAPPQLCRAQAGRARPRVSSPLLCPQASKVLPPGKVFPAEEKLRFGAKVFSGGIMGSRGRLVGRVIKKNINQRRLCGCDFPGRPPGQLLAREW